MLRFLIVSDIFIEYVINHFENQTACYASYFFLYFLQGQITSKVFHKTSNRSNTTSLWKLPVSCISCWKMVTMFSKELINLIDNILSRNQVMDNIHEVFDKNKRTYHHLSSRIHFFQKELFKRPRIVPKKKVLGMVNMRYRNFSFLKESNPQSYYHWCFGGFISLNE